MRSQVARRFRTNSNPLTALPPAPTSTEYSTPLANLAARILYLSPLPSPDDLPVYILNSWGFPDTKTVDYDALLPYVLARLPDDDELIASHGYEVVFFAGGGGANEAAQPKKGRPGWGWLLQAYQLLSRATRKRLKKLYIVHEKNWIRVLVETFATVVSPKFRKKIVHVSTITALALHMPVQDLLIPPTAYLSDRRKSPNIYAPNASGRRAFGVKEPLHTSADRSLRLPRILRETTSFIIMDENVKTEGVFRVSARVQFVDILKEAYDRGQKFVVWKEMDAVLASNYRQEGTGDVWVEELDQTEGYDLHTAAALVKMWYKELREPIFPPSSYQVLDKFFGQPHVSLDPPHLLAILSMNDEWSPISSKTSRLILTMHLLPLLSRVADFSDRNQMTPDNLALCFAPNLLHGPDPIADLQISFIIRRILTAMIIHWEKDLAPHLETSFERFEESLRMPESVEDREDPLEEEQTNETTELEAQTSGITLLDNDNSDEELESPLPPPLPPRPNAPSIGRKPLNNSSTSLVTESPLEDTNLADICPPNASHTSLPNAHFIDTLSQSKPHDPNNSADTPPVRRKPAPALMPLPRYSTIVHDRPAVFQETQYYNTVAPDEDAELVGENSTDGLEDGLPVYENLGENGGADVEAEEARPTLPPRPTLDGDAAADSAVQRKPVPKAG